MDPAIDQGSAPAKAADELTAEDTLASRLNNSRILSLLIGLLGIAIWCSISWTASR